MSMQIRPKVNVGDRFSRWTVTTEPVRVTYSRHRAAWVVGVRCDCGRTNDARRLCDLMGGRTKGCVSCHIRQTNTERAVRTCSRCGSTCRGHMCAACAQTRSERPLGRCDCGAVIFLGGDLGHECPPKDITAYLQGAGGSTVHAFTRYH